MLEGNWWPPIGAPGAAVACAALAELPLLPPLLLMSADVSVVGEFVEITFAEIVVAFA